MLWRERKTWENLRSQISRVRNDIPSLGPPELKQAREQLDFLRAQIESVENELNEVRNRIWEEWEPRCAGHTSFRDDVERLKFCTQVWLVMGSIDSEYGLGLDSFDDTWFDFSQVVDDWGATYNLHPFVQTEDPGTGLPIAQDMRIFAEDFFAGVEK